VGRKTRAEKEEEELTEREKRKEFVDNMLDSHQPYQESKIYYRDWKAGVTDEDGRLVLTSLKPNTVYTAYDLYELSDLVPLANSGIRIIDPRDLPGAH